MNLVIGIANALPMALIFWLLVYAAWGIEVLMISMLACGAIVITSRLWMTRKH